MRRCKELVVPNYVEKVALENDEPLAELESIVVDGGDLLESVDGSELAGRVFA